MIAVIDQSSSNPSAFIDTMSQQHATFFCSTCQIQLESAQAQRLHAKDESHIYKLRCRIAEPGTVVSALPILSKGAGDDSNSQSESDSDFMLEEDSVEDAGQTDNFLAEQCLFCGLLSASFNANSMHMSTAHSFIVPYQNSLQVDIETLIWYLQFVIHRYHECILCGSRRSTLEAVQQHMLGKGHCRFDTNGEVADFYDSSILESKVEELMQPDEASLRLSSGKILTHRSHLQQTTRLPHSLRRNQATSTQVLGSPNEEDPSSTAGSSTSLTRLDKKSNALTVQLSQLSANDQRGLMHLSIAEQRSVLATRKKQLDMAKRQERQMMMKVERLGNKVLMKHFKIDVPGRSNG